MNASFIVQAEVSLRPQLGRTFWVNSTRQILLGQSHTFLSLCLDLYCLKQRPAAFI